MHHSAGGCWFLAVDIWKLSIVSVQFCCEPKTAVKNKDNLKEGKRANYKVKQKMTTLMSLKSHHKLIFIAISMYLTITKYLGGH